MIKNREVSRKKLCESIAHTFYQDMMPFRPYRIIDKCLDEYGLDPVVIYALFDIASEYKFLYDFDCIERVAEAGYRDGIQNKYLALRSIKPGNVVLFLI